MKPNIVFILADDLGYGDFSIFNDGVSETPRLDALIAESICLTQAYTGSTVCNPSRACLLTGRYPHRTGSIDTLDWWGVEKLSLRERTLADALKGAGYTTGLMGKWHLGCFEPAYHPLRRGFDETVCFRGGMHDYYQWRVEFGETARRTDGTYLTDLWTEESTQFIKRHRQEPFFLHVTYNAPHGPYQAPEEDIAPFRGKPGINDTVATLYGMVRCLDKGVGRILDTLDECGLRENTIVVFSSDNGPDLGGKVKRFNCNFAGMKTNCYEGGIRVPMIVRWPAGLPGGRENHEMLHFSDWYPTLLAMAGVELPEGQLPLDGVDALPMLREERGSTGRTRCWQWNRLQPVRDCNAAIRDGDWKLVRPWVQGAFDTTEDFWLFVSMYGPEHFLHNGNIDRPWPDREIGPVPPAQLYNIATDPGETKDISADHPQIASRLEQALRVWFDDVELERSTTPEYIARAARWAEYGGPQPGLFN